MQPSSVDGVALLSDAIHALTRESRTCVVRVTDGTREGQLRFEHGELVEVRFGQLHGASAMVALMSASGLHHELVEPREASAEPEQASEAEARDEPEQTPRAESPRDEASVDAADPLASAPESDAEQVTAADTVDRDLAQDPSASAPSSSGAVEADAPAVEVAPPADTPPWETDASAALSQQPSWELEAEAGAELARAEVPPWEADMGTELAVTAPSPSEHAEGPAATGGAEPDAAAPAKAADTEPAVPACEAADASPKTRELEDLPEVHTLPESQEAAAVPSSLPPETAPEGGAVAVVGPRRSDWPRASRPAIPPRLGASLAVGALAVIAALLLWKPAQQRRSEPQRATQSATSAPAAASAATLVDMRLPEWREGPAPVAPPNSTLVPTVQLRLLVGEDGQVGKVEVVASRPGLAQFEERAIEAARQHRYAPATRGGRPVQAWTTLLLAFEPPAGPTAKVVIKGSEAIGSALGSAWTEAFEKSQPGLQLRIEALGTKTGFAGLLDGTADLAAASHVIGDDELALAAKLGIALREIVLGQDGVAVIVHPDNPVRELDLASLARIFRQQVTRWDELSGEAAPIQLLVRPSYSGTRHSFEDRVLSAAAPEQPAVEPLPARVETGQETVQRVASDPHAIGYVSIGLLQPSVRAVALKARADAAAVMPSEASIRDASYPIVQPVLLYARADASYGARAFAQFAVSQAGQDLLPRHHFVALPSPGPRFSLGEPSAISFLPPDLLRIYFKRNTAHIAAAPWHEFWAQAARLGAGGRALVVGHTDSTGDAEINHRLAQLRASLVANLLRRMGGADAPIEQEVARSEYPLASNETAEGQSSNRRVDVYVLPR